MFLLTLFLGFLLGALTILGVEALGVLFVIDRLNRKIKETDAKAASKSHRELHADLDPKFSFDLSSYQNKQGFVWILEFEKVPKTWLADKVPREQKRKKELEVTPVRKYAKIKDRSLILTDSDRSYTEIRLKGCLVEAISATSLSSRKWAKRYPIKVESKTSVIYRGSKIFYIYLDTCGEKELWCKALRLASCNDREKWFAKLNSEFHGYLASLNIEYPSFMKPSMGFNAEQVDRSIKVDGSSSKVRHFLKKLAKKASKTGVENKVNWTLTSDREERKIGEKSRPFQDSVLATGLIKTAPTGKAPNCSAQESIGSSLSSSFTNSGSRSHVSVISDTDSDDKILIDDGTLCWNLLISRLFFDAKNNEEMRSSLQERIQRTLSNMRIPSYIGEITCTGINPGNVPPYIHGMRVLSLDMNGVCAFEIDIEYNGGALVDIETRLEVRELDSNLESSSVEEVTSELLEGVEYFGKQLKLSEGTVDAIEQKDEGDLKLDGIKGKSALRGSSHVSRWKSIVNSVAKQVSQVPISLAIRVAYLRGTIQLRIQPPPSDQIWFGFTSMPDIDFNLESSVGEHKISSGSIASFLISRFKTAIRDAAVLPNCESVCIPWMLADKDDWAPKKVAPFIWINQEAVADPAESEGKHEKAKKVECVQGESLDKHASSSPVHEKAKKVEPVQRASSDKHASSSVPSNQSVCNSKSMQELSTPLLRNDEPQDIFQWSKEENSDNSQSSSRSMSFTENQEVDARPKRVGRKARMLDLGKKMGEKLDEKRRNIEERGRNIVERMRAP